MIVAPIYYEGMVLICITLSGVGLPGVNLIIYKDDLRMMAPNPVAAKEGGIQTGLRGVVMSWWGGEIERG